MLAMAASLSSVLQTFWSPRQQRSWQQYARAARRPTCCLLVLIPLALAYELTIRLVDTGHAPLLAHSMLHGLLAWFGLAGWWVPPLTLIVSLLVWHRIRRDRWHVRWWVLPGMLLEGVVLTIPLLVISGLFPLPDHATTASLTRRLLHALGAGIYEELVFRLLLISGLMALLGAGLDLRRAPATWTAIIVAALLFALCHYRPIGADAFAWGSFWFRAAAGTYLAIIYWYRGIGVAGVTHAAFNALRVSFEAAGADV